MDVSFVVPLYNCLPYTQAMVASLQASLPAGLAYEIILVDDGSSDGTREWLAALSDPFRVLLHATNQGYAAANNHGAALARGALLFLVNNDLLFSRGWIEPLLAAHRRWSSRAGLIGNIQRDLRTGRIDHAGIFINHKGKPEHRRRRPALPVRLVAPVRPTLLLTGACLSVRRDLWRELDGFDEGYVNGCEDVDLCLRAAAAGRTNLIAWRSTVGHHISTTPGRKDRDEANTYRLTLRWGDQLTALGRPDWCRHYFETYLPEPRDFPDPALARQVACYLVGLRRQPPPGAAAGMRAAIGVELTRWRSLLPVGS